MKIRLPFPSRDITAHDQSMVKSGMTDRGKLLLVLTFSNEFDNTNISCLAVTKRFGKILLESTWNTIFCIVPAENFWEQRNI